MSLQGTLATFSIPDVMQLLASTKKSGRLSVEGDQGQGEVYLDAGLVVAATTIGAVTSEDPATVLLALLRYEDGSFVFEDGAAPPDPSKGVAVAKLLTLAAELEEEWSALEAVVPSADAWLTLAAELPSDTVEIDREGWRLVQAVGTGATAARLATALDTDVMGVARLFKGMVEASLIAVAPEAPAGADVAPSAPEPEAWSPDPVIEDVAEEADDTVIDLDAQDAGDDAASWEPTDFADADADAGVDEDESPAPEDEAAPVESFTDAPSWAPLGGEVDESDELDEPEPIAPSDDGGFDPNALLREIGMAPAGDDDGFLPSADGGLGGLGGLGGNDDHLVDSIDPEDAAEMARQLASLSPEAAKAVAAAATASTEAELQAALDEVVALDSSINRDLLMKFLGSVNS